jgi:transcriptional regulator with XRE-family HTH domain
LNHCLSQEALAERVAIPQLRVSAIELGVKFPNLLTVLRLALALECKVMDLVGLFDSTYLPSILPKSAGQRRKRALCRHGTVTMLESAQ